MHLSKEDIALFYKLWYAMVWGINEKHKIIPRFKKPVYGTRVAVSLEEFKKIRDTIWEKPELIDEFLAGHNKGEFTDEERKIILEWRKYFVKKRFLIVKHLAKYSVLMSFEGEPNTLYGVQGISDSIKDAIPYPLPLMLDFVLLPFKGVIIYDTFAEISKISFGAGMRSSIKIWYDEAKEKYGIFEVLDGKIPAAAPKTVVAKKNAAKPKEPQNVDAVIVPENIKVPRAMYPRYLEIAEIIEEFCTDKLNDEYRELCFQALMKLCRKRPSPLLSGKANTWACGIIYAIGSNNFIFDKAQPIHMTAADIADWFGLSKSTAGAKSTEITKLLDLSYFNSEFQLKDLIEDNLSV